MWEPIVHDLIRSIGFSVDFDDIRPMLVSINDELIRLGRIEAAATALVTAVSAEAECGAQNLLAALLRGDV